MIQDYLKIYRNTPRPNNYSLDSILKDGVVDIFELSNKVHYTRPTERATEPAKYSLYNVAVIEMEECIARERRLAEVIRIARTRDPKYFVTVSNIAAKIVKDLEIQ